MIRFATYEEILTDYCEAVLSGEIVACDLLTKAVTKFVDELELAESKSDEFPFYFDWSVACKYCQIFPALLRHSKGEWAGQPFDLSPWQVFVVANIFGWKRNHDDKRRHQKVFLSVARKNGKTSICAGMELIMLFLDQEAGAEIYIGATKLDQARLIHEEAERMLKKSPALARHAEIFKNNISFGKTNSFARPLGSDRPFDGLNPSACFFDEFHAWRETHRKFYDTMTTGSGSRQQPLQMIITTAADDKSQLYHEEANYARGVISGDIQDRTLFALIFELDKDDDPFDDDFDIEILRKANPNYGVSVKPEYLKQQLTEAKQKPQSKNRFVRYHGNRCVSSVEEAITAEIWDAAAGPLSDWSTSDGIGCGIDLGGQDDLAAYALAAKFKVAEDDEGRPIYRHEVFSRCFISSKTKARDLNEQPWAQWIAEGHLIACEYVVSTLKQYLIDDCQQHGVEFVAFDPYQASQLAEDLEAEGLKAVKMPQSPIHFHETMQEYLAQLSEGRFTPDENDVLLRWCALNMAIKTDSAGRTMPDKSHSKDKIDAAVAMLMAKRATNLALPRITGPLFIT